MLIDSAEVSRRDVAADDAAAISVNPCQTDSNCGRLQLQNSDFHNFLDASEQGKVFEEQEFIDASEQGKVFEEQELPASPSCPAPSESGGGQQSISKLLLDSVTVLHSVG